MKYHTLYYISLILLVGCASTEQSDNKSTKTAKSVPSTPDSKGVQESDSKIVESGRSGEVIVSIDLATALSKEPLNLLAKIRATAQSDPFYKKQITGEGIPFDIFLKTIPELKGLDRSAHSLRFVCSDGYKTTFPFSAIEGAQGVVAAQMLDDGKLVEWPSILRGKEKQTAGPYYLLWHEQKYDKHRPWPYQWTRLEIISNASAYAALTPPEGTKVSEGFKLFKTHCNACHSVNLKGGKLGPELNVPRNILSYRDRAQVLAFIKNPQDFRAGSLMPAMPLPSKDIEAIVDYLDAMKGKQICKERTECQGLLAKTPR